MIANLSSVAQMPISEKLTVLFYGGAKLAQIWVPALIVSAIAVWFAARIADKK